MFLLHGLLVSPFDSMKGAFITSKIRMILLGKFTIVAGNILAYVNIEEAETVSKLWYYCGYGVEKDGKASSKRAGHLNDIPYIDKDGKPKTKKGIRYNPKVRSKLWAVLGPGLLKAKDEYKEMYDNERNRLVHRQAIQGKEELPPYKLHSMAMRKIIKEFLKRLYPVWREHEGLYVRPPYDEVYLGRTHGTHGPTLGKLGDELPPQSPVNP